MVVLHVQGTHMVVLHVQGTGMVVLHVQGTGMVVLHVQGTGMVVLHVQGTGMVVLHVQGIGMVVIHVQGTGMVALHVQGTHTVCPSTSRTSTGHIPYLQEGHTDKCTCMSRHLAEGGTWSLYGTLPIVPPDIQYSGSGWMCPWKLSRLAPPPPMVDSVLFIGGTTPPVAMARHSPGTHPKDEKGSFPTPGQGRSGDLPLCHL